MDQLVQMHHARTAFSEHTRLPLEITLSECNYFWKLYRIVMRAHTIFNTFQSTRPLPLLSFKFAVN